MKLSAPIYILKQQAKALSRSSGLRLHAALDQVATREGFSAWGHLASAWQRQDTTRIAYRQLEPGDLVLVGSRPGHGKTLFGAGLALEAMSRGLHAVFFTLEDTAAEVDRRVSALGRTPAAALAGRWLVDTSDDICAEYIARRIAGMPPGTLVVIDYLQLLDQRRDKPSLDLQLQQLAATSRATQAVIVCLSQIGRAYTLTARAFPAMQDVRLPNPADLSLFTKAWFLQDGKMQLHVAGAGASS